MLCTYQYFQPEADKDGRTVLFDWELDEAEELQERRFVPVFRGTVSLYEQDGKTAAAPTDKDFRNMAELMFMLHNADDRPRGQEIRSMSVGDIILFTGNGVQEALQVDGCGFRDVEVVEIDHAVHIIR